MLRFLNDLLASNLACTLTRIGNPHFVVVSACTHEELVHLFSEGPASSAKVPKRSACIEPCLGEEERRRYVIEIRENIQASIRLHYN